MKRFLLPLVLAVSTTSLLSAQNVVDVNQPIEDLGGFSTMAFFSQGDLAQSFIPNASNCSGGGALMSAGLGVGGTFTVQLWDALPTAGGTMLATGSAPAAPGTWVDVFWPAVPVTPGNTYYMVYLCTDGGMGLGGSLYDPYPGGMVHANPGFGSWPAYDYTFNTWTDAGGGGLTLSVTGTCPGTMTLSVSGAGAGNSVAIIYGSAGSFTIPGGSCAGLALGIAAPSLGVMLTADSAGDASTSPSMPGAACGLTIQAVDLGACAASNTAVL